MDEKINKVILNLQRNNMAGYFVENKEDLIQLIASLVKKGERVGCGDSVTLEETGVFEFIRGGDFVFYDKHQRVDTRGKYERSFDYEDKQADIYKITL